MQYFVGYPPYTPDLEGFDPSPSGWLLPPTEDVPAAPGDEVFLVGCGIVEASACLVNHIIVGRLRSLLDGFEVIPDRSAALPDVPLPEEVAVDLPQLDEGMERRSLLPLNVRTGRVLHRISKPYLRPTG